jgi:hypothetical protein
MNQPSTVIYRPQREHHCNIGWELRELAPDHPAREVGSTHYYVHAPDEPAGTVRQCATCGQTWVAYDPPRHGSRMFAFSQWRREGRLERWRRERRLKRARQADHA